MCVVVVDIGVNRDSFITQKLAKQMKNLVRYLLNLGQLFLLYCFTSFISVLLLGLGGWYFTNSQPRCSINDSRSCSLAEMRRLKIQ